MIPKVSICIPAYLQTQYLKRTLDSVLIQDYNDYEIIITDDSPGTTVKNLVSGYAFGPKLVYLHNTQQLGSPANWNQAVRVSRGEYIKILHHDDWLSSASSLSQFVEMLDSNPEVGFAFSGAMAQIAETEKVSHHYTSDLQTNRLRSEPTYIFFGNFIGPPSSTIMRRTSFVEYDKNLIWTVDIAQYIQILQSTNFVSTQKPLIVSITQAPHQLTNVCAKNKRLNIYEYFYLFDTIKALVPNALQHTYINYLVELILRYNIKSIEEIRQSGYQGAIPSEILSSINSSSLTRGRERMKLYLSKQLKLFMSSFL